jgi:hypothetical protein
LKDLRRIKMKNDEEKKNLQDTILDMKVSFTEVYLILVSIIQGTVFGFLFVKFYDHYNDFTPLKIIILLTTFLLIIMIWNQYMIGSTALRFKPQLFPDSIIIFTLGFTETLVIYHIFTELYLWCFSMAVVTFMSWLTTVNALNNAQRYKINEPIFQKLGYWPKLFQIVLFITVILYVILGYVSYQYATTETIQYVIASIFLIFTLMYLAGGFKYWEIIMSKPNINK